MMKTVVGEGLVEVRLGIYWYNQYPHLQKGFNFLIVLTGLRVVTSLYVIHFTPVCLKSEFHNYEERTSHKKVSDLQSKIPLQKGPRWCWSVETSSQNWCGFNNLVSDYYQLRNYCETLKTIRWVVLIMSINTGKQIQVYTRLL